MKMVPRVRCMSVALCLLALSSAFSGCATTTHNVKSSHAEAKQHQRPQSIRPLTGSYALSDESTTFDSSIMERGAKARGTEYGY